MNRNSILLLVLGAILVAALGWMMSGPQSSGVDSISILRPDDEEITGAPGLAGGEPLELAGPHLADQGLQRVQADPEESLFDDGETLLVRVFDEDGETLVSGAQVTVYPHDELPDGDWRLLLHEQPDVERLFAAGISGRTSYDGTVRLPRPPAWFGVCARKQDLFTFTTRGIHEDASQVDLYLAPDGDLRVRVVDGDDEGVADVPVLLQRRVQNSATNLMQVRTDAQGRAVFPHARALYGGGGRMRGGPWVTVGLPLAPQPGEEPDFDALEQELELPFGPTGAVRVRALDYDGRALADGTRILLQTIRENSRVSANRFNSQPLAGMASAEVEDGEALFPRVGLGLFLQAGVLLDGHRWWASATGKGPTVAGEEAVLELRQGTLRAQIRLLVLGLDQQPLAHAEIQVREQRRTSSRTRDYNRTLTTDAEGYLVHTLDAGEMGRNIERKLVISYLPARGARAWQGELDLSQDYPEGVHDRGRVQLQAPRPAGRRDGQRSGRRTGRRRAGQPACAARGQQARAAPLASGRQRGAIGRERPLRDLRPRADAADGAARAARRLLVLRGARDRRRGEPPAGARRRPPDHRQGDHP